MIPKIVCNYLFILCVCVLLYSRLDHWLYRVCIWWQSHCHDFAKRNDGAGSCSPRLSCSSEETRIVSSMHICWRYCMSMFLAERAFVVR